MSIAASLLSLLVPSLQTEAPQQNEAPAVAYESAFPAQSDFDKPVFVAFTATDPDHAYVVCQPGEVVVVPRDKTKAERRTFLDIGDAVLTKHMEEGLLGFAFDPDYANNGHVFVYWSEAIEARREKQPDGRQVKSDRQSVISRFGTKVENGVRVVDPSTQLRVLQIFEPFPNHNGGTILFGPDGMLYIALGDGGAANDPFANAQSKQSLLGKVLRIDVRSATKEKPYAIPADNPFAKEDGARGEIWCYGMRNPWRLSFDRANGDLWCGDVGQDRIEEVDRLVKGGNYGWNWMEASEVFVQRRPKAPVPEGLQMIAPIAEYPRKDGISVTGGHVYRGKALPALVGQFVYGDFVTLRVWAVREDRENGKHRVVSLARAPMPISSFAEEPDGELLVCGWADEGKIFRIVPAPAAVTK